MTASQPDPRLNAYRPDLADEKLRGTVTAKSFVVPWLMHVTAPVAPVLKAPQLDATQTTQALMGEDCLVFESAGGFSWVQLKNDGYVGYVEERFLAKGTSAPTHRVAVASTLAFPKPDLRSRPVQQWPLNAMVTVVATTGAFAELASGAFVFSIHLIPLATFKKDFVAVAELFLNTPYFWGGKSVHGIDCSGLVQSALQACGIPAPRDSDMQEKQLGRTITGHNYQRGDLIFWPGHVGIMFDSNNLLHANGHSMSTVIEPLAETVQRSEQTGKLISSIKRL